MLKYVNTDIVFQEIPDETTLAINISRCPCHCPGCHSSYLAGDFGLPLSDEAIDGLIADNDGMVTCVCLMGGDAEPASVNSLAAHIRRCHPEMRVGWYSGRLRIDKAIDKGNFDYIKVGPYIKHLGALNSRTTNQRLYRVENNQLCDITSRFWRH